MSPWRSQGVLQAGVAVIERNAPVESLIEMDFGSGKTEALPLRRDLETLALPLHDVVVADHALVDEAADAVQISGAGRQAVCISRGRRAKRRLKSATNTRSTALAESRSWA